MLNFKDSKNKSSALTTRWAQMSKQEQIIERKRMEIEAKAEAQKQAAALAAQAKLINPGVKQESNSPNIFSNDGSFMSQYKKLLEQKKEKEERDKQKALEDEQKNKAEIKQEIEKFDDNFANNDLSNDRKPRDRHWPDSGNNSSNSPMTPVMEHRKKLSEHRNIPSLMQIPVMPPEPLSPSSIRNEQWSQPDSECPADMDNKPNNPSMGDPNIMPPGFPPMGPGSMGQGPPMGPVSMGQGPPMGPGSMRQGPSMGPGMMNSASSASNNTMGPNNVFPGPHPMGPWGPGGNGPMPNNLPNMGPGPMMRPGGPMPPFMGGRNFPPMPPNFMGPNGPRNMPPNMRGPGPNGPMPPFFPPFSNPPMMRPNGPPNSMMPPNGNDNSNNPNMPFMRPRPPFGPNGPNFGPNGPRNMPFMPPGMPNVPRLTEPIPEQGIPPSDSMNPTTSTMAQQSNEPNDLDPHMPQVFSADRMPPVVQRAAFEVATNGDHWENVLKSIHSQDQNMWFLHNQNSNEYKSFRDLVNKIRSDGQAAVKPEVKPEDKYEPEFSLEDDDSNDAKPDRQDNNSWKTNTPWTNNIKAEHNSSQSDDDSDMKKERRKRRKSRWGDDPPVTDIKPPGVMTAMQPSITGPKLAKIDGEGLKLTNLNQQNPALLQYAMMNFGSTNLSPEDWKKCEDNFKLNLLYQDMLKKRQEVERLNAAGKHKYEYDSDEDTSEGTWEHRLRAKEMFATEKWADELTKQAAGKHHIGDFLPPEELRKFMEKYSAARGGKEPDLSDYKEYKLKEDNVGFKMLQKLGWNEGQGLGAEGTGIVEPINKANQPMANLGLGASTSDNVSPDDDEFDAYRKRMMLAYRFRPNPLNNPRRPYY
ncbi:unnamed protein product [Leptosia nina]|uniref:G-patch domain-containing protein n=1 Tax=Leptosia nina TaxID=320188 RepID=A0AAV1J1G1_9NEOP